MSLRFQVCDLNAIETRCGAYLAQCPDLLSVFEPYTDIFGEWQKNGRDPYLSFACKMYGLQYDQIYADYKGKNGKERKADAKRMRQISKPGVLGAIYRLAGGQVVTLHTDKCKDAHRMVKGFYECDNGCPKGKSGLWAYADNMGVEMSMKQAHGVVEIFRNSYPEICSNDRANPGIWKRLEDAVADVMHPDHPNTVRYIGPNNAVKIDRINLGYYGSNGKWVKEREPVMRMQLPSQRYLHYIDAHLAPTKMPWMGTDEDGEPVEVFRDALVYAGTNQKTKQWESTVNTHGGKLFENLVQGIARDVLSYFMLQAEEKEMNIVGHVHDEIIGLVEDDLLSPNVCDMVEMMSKPVPWAPTLLLGADGYQDPYYHK